MRPIRFLAIALFLFSCLAGAWAQGVPTVVSISNNNSSLKVTVDPLPIQFPRMLEWTVDGRRILVYPSGPSAGLEIVHLHSDSHVGSSQIHAQGPSIENVGKVVGGIVYTVAGDTDGSLSSRISEKVDIINKTGTDLSLLLTGLGYKPTSPFLEVPDLTGLNVTGTTVIFFVKDKIAELPFGQVTVLPVVSFSGFNPLNNQQVTIPDGATLTMITELKVSRASARPFNPHLPPNLLDDLLRSPFSRFR